MRTISRSFLPALVLLAGVACDSPDATDDAADEVGTDSDADATETDTTDTTDGTDETNADETETGEPAYPGGPYGVEVGDTFGPYEWVHADGSPFYTEDLFNLPQRAIMMYGTAAWCGSCKAEVAELTPLFGMFPDDIRSVGVLFEDNFGNNPSAETAAGYSTPDIFAFVADTERDFNNLIFPGAGAIPMVLVIDSRDMTITFKQVGHDKNALIQAVNDLLLGE